MSTEPNRTPTDPAPQAHRHAQELDPPPYEMVISPTQAVCEALAALGRDASVADVQRFLQERGMSVDEEMIERIRAEVENHCDTGLGGNP